MLSKWCGMEMPDASSSDESSMMFVSLYDLPLSTRALRQRRGVAEECSAAKMQRAAAKAGLTDATAMVWRIQNNNNISMSISRTSVMMEAMERAIRSLRVTSRFPVNGHYWRTYKTAPPLHRYKKNPPSERGVLSLPPSAVQSNPTTLHCVYKITHLSSEVVSNKSFTRQPASAPYTLCNKTSHPSHNSQPPFLSLLPPMQPSGSSRY